MPTVTRTMAACLLIVSCESESGPPCRLAPMHDTVGPAHPDLCRHADHAVVGFVEDLTSRLGNAEEGRLEGRIVTDVQFQVTDVLAGPDSAADVLTLVVEGGDLDGVSHRSTGSPPFVRDRWYLLFLADYPGGGPPGFLSVRQLPATTVSARSEWPVFDQRWREVCEANPEGLHPMDIMYADLGFFFGHCPARLH